MWTLQYVNVEMALRLCLHRCARACIVSDYQCYISARAHFSVLTAQTFFFFQRRGRLFSERWCHFVYGGTVRAFQLARP